MQTAAPANVLHIGQRVEVTGKTWEQGLVGEIIDIAAVFTDKPQYKVRFEREHLIAAASDAVFASDDERAAKFFGFESCRVFGHDQIATV